MPTSFEKLSHPSQASSVTPNDTTVLTPGVLYVGGAGDLTVETAGGDEVTFTSVAAGTFLPILISKVKVATTATNILILK